MTTYHIAISNALRPRTGTWMTIPMVTVLWIDKVPGGTTPVRFPTSMATIVSVVTAPQVCGGMTIRLPGL